jgi:hypothetical protein
MSERWIRTAILAIAAVNLAIGLYAGIAPASFFNHVGDYGARNTHYVGDVASFYLAAGLGLLVAAARPSWRVPLLAVVALWWALHALNHLVDIGQASSDAKGVRDTILIGLGAAAIAYVGWACARPRSGGDSTDRVNGGLE